jgi:hypothetical protein
MRLPVKQTWEYDPGWIGATDILMPGGFGRCFGYYAVIQEMILRH